MKNKFVLGDPGFAGVAKCVPGYKRKHLPKNPAAELFDKQSRSEQVIIENINSMIKKARVLDKEIRFRHSRDKLIMSIFIVCGLYNFRLLNKDN